MELWKKRGIVALVILGLVMIVNSLFFYNYYRQVAVPDANPTYRNVNNGGDQMVYFSLIRQASEGKNLLLNLYTNEPQVGMISPLWWLLGKLVRYSHLTIPVLYYLVTMASAAGLLAFVLYLTRNLFVKYWQRLAVLPIMSLGGGLGIFYIFNVLFPPGGKPLNEEYLFTQVVSADLWYGEGFGFLSLRHSPLFILSQLSLAVFFWWIAEKIDVAKWWQLLVVGGGAFLLALVHPYDAVPLAAFALVYGVIYWRQRINWINWLKMVPIGVGVLLAAAYFYYLKIIDPSFLGWSMQNVTRSPYSLSFLAGYFWLLIPAVYGCVLAFRGSNKRWQWLAVWLVVLPILVFIPSQVQRRFGSGVYIPMAMLAWYGWLSFWKNRNVVLTWLVSSVYALFLGMTFALILALNIGIINSKAQLTNITSSELNTLKFYESISTEQDTLLSSFSFGNLAPAYIARKMYIGHGHQTVNWPEKKAFALWFYGQNGEEETKHQQLIKRQIDYVWADNNFELINKKLFELVYENDDVKLYKVIR